MIPLILKEDASVLFDVTTSTPAIEFAGDWKNVLDNQAEFEVKVEGTSISKSVDFVYSYMVMFAAYYVFNLAYPQRLHSTMAFMQKFLLNIGDKIKVKPKVLSLMAKLKSA